MDTITVRLEQFRGRKVVQGKPATCSWSAIVKSRLGKCLALLSLLLLTTFPAIASFDSPTVVNPYSSTSPSGKFVCEIDPTEIYGRGDARYRILKNGSVVWEGTKPFTLFKSAVTDEGIVAGYGYTFGENGFSGNGFKKGAGDFVIAIIEPTGKLRLHESVARSMSRFLHDVPNPLAGGIVLDGPGNRFIVRLRNADINNPGEIWWVYEITSGKKVAETGLTSEEARSASPIQAVPILGTPLILVHYWQYRHPDVNARFALVDSDFNEVWSMTWLRDYNISGNEDAEDQLREKIWAKGAILDTSKSNRFTLLSARDAEEVFFTVQQDAQKSNKWTVSEIDRRKHIPAQKKAEKAFPSKTNALTLLGSFSLNAARPAENEIFQNVIGFGFDGTERIGLLRRGHDEAYSFSLIDTNGVLVKHVALPNSAKRNLSREVKFAWVTNNQWIVTSSELTTEGKTTAWWLDAPSGKLDPISKFSAPAVQSLTGTPDGGFVALCVHHYEYTMEDELIAFDRSGNVRWTVKQDYANQEALFSPEDITWTTDGRLDVLDNIRKSIQSFDLAGNFIKSIDLEKAWGRKPNYPTEIARDKSGGVLIYDFHGTPPIVRMDREGKVTAQFLLKHKDGRVIDPTYGVRVSPAGRVWACDGASLVRVTDEGVADLVLGAVPGGATLGGIAGLIVDQDGKTYAVDERSGEVHVFEQNGRRVRVCTPLNTDFTEKLSMPDIAVNERGEVFLSSEHSFPEKPAYVHFSPDGKRVGIKQTGLDISSEHWHPLPGDRILVLGYHDAFIVDGKGNVQRKIQRRPDGNWLENPYSASVAPDGTFAIVSGGLFWKAPFRVSLYSANGDPIRTVVLPDSCRPYCFTYTGKYLATSTESAICLFSTLGEPIISFEYPMEMTKERWWNCHSTKGGQELWMSSMGLKKIYRFALP